MLHAHLYKTHHGRISEIRPDLHLTDDVLVLHACDGDAVATLVSHGSIEVKSPIPKGFVAENIIEILDPVLIELVDEE